MELITPIPVETTKKLHVGDIVFITGTLITARDAAHRRIKQILLEGRTPPYTFKGIPLFHCGPIVKKHNKEWKIIAAGPTTSMRMDVLEPFLIEKLGVNFIIGKGGMGKSTQEALIKYGGVYAAFPGGAAALAATKIKKVINVKWLDLGIPEALWKLEVEKFGPLIIAMDSYGNNIYENVLSKIST